MKEILEAADGYVPLMQTLVWPILLLVLGFVFRVQVRNIYAIIKNRIDSGADFKVAGLEVGKLVTQTSDLGDEIKTFGNPDQLKLLFKAQGRGWKKSTKALELPHGCIIQVTTERQSADGDWANAEALVFVPAVRLAESGDQTCVVVER